MHKTVGSASATRRNALNTEDLVWSIANELKPWTHPKNEVLAEVHKTIDELREELRIPPEIGFRTDNRPMAKKCIAVLEKAQKQLCTLPPTFIASVARATYFDETLTIWNLEDWNEYLRRLDEEAEKLRKEFTELIERIAKLSERCKQATLAPVRFTTNTGEPIDDVPTGVISKPHYWKEMAAISAGGLMSRTSTKLPAAGSSNTSFCVIASRLFEIVTGEREPNLVRACKWALAGIRLLDDG
jgi:hypothetical protein